MGPRVLTHLQETHKVFIQQKLLSREVCRGSLLSPCAPRAGDRSFLAAMATCDHVLVTFKTLGLVTAPASANVNI